MATKTVLEYVQNALSVMDSDNVDSINDTAEASQIANQLKEVYDEIMNRQDWPFLSRAITLNAAVDTDNPTQFAIPENIKLIDELSYNVSEDSGYIRKDLRWCEPREFLQQLADGEDDSTKQLITYGAKLQFYVRNDHWPTFWTTFDDINVVMDAFNNSFDSTLMTTKLHGWGIVIPSLTITDTTVPAIPLHMEPLLQAELNRECFLYFKQTESVPDERKARRQIAQARRNGARVGRDQHGRKQGHGR